jgi:hypothetical protein
MVRQTGKQNLEDKTLKQNIFAIEMFSFLEMITFTGNKVYVCQKTDPLLLDF